MFVSRPRVSGGSLARHISLQTAGVLVVFVVLAMAQVFTASQFERMTERMNEAAEDLEVAHNLEVAVLMHRRENLIWSLTRDSFYREQRERHMVVADRFAAVLDTNLLDPLDEPDEVAALIELRAQYAVFRAAVRRDPDQPPEALRADVNKLIASLDAYRQANNTEMTATIRASRSLNSAVRAMTTLLTVFLPILLGVSGYLLFQRVIRPVIGLSKAAERFGAGDLAARAPLMRGDELGALVHVFNSMADDIRDREKARFHFLSAVVHDLRNPLAVILGAAHLLRDRATDDHQTKWLDRILQKIRVLDQMSEDLVESAKIEAGTITLVPAPFDLSHLAEEVTAEFRTADESRSILFESDGPCEIMGDRNRLERVLANLLSNAVKYSPESSVITVRVSKETGSAVLSVTDQGSGIEDEDRKSLFLPFGRLARTAGKVKGTGLGLYSVKRIVEAHQGSVTVHSVVGEGTRFEIRLPV